MADQNLRRSFRSRDGAPFVIFLILSLAINGVGAYCGWWLKFPEPVPQKDDAIELTNIDTNDVEKLGDPNAQEEPPPPEPEPTPPPDPEPTPPPLDKPPEFEIPAATPTPAPQSTPHPTPHPKDKKPSPNAAATPGMQKGQANGVVGGTGTGGARSGKLVRSPKPPYPTQAL